MAAARIQVNIKPRRLTTDELYDEIKSAIGKGLYCYIGEAEVTAEQTAKDAVYECQGRQDYERGFWVRPKHRPDKEDMDKKLRCLGNGCTDALKAESADKLYYDLRGRYLIDPLFVNDNSADPIDKTLKGSVYLVTYEYTKC